jgi:hypothetical protein
MGVPGVPAVPGVGTYYYPNQQSARLMWYHDHAMGITRTNAYAGIASAYLLTDDFEAALIRQGILPGLGIPLIIQDKSFVPDGIAAIDPAWQWGAPGDLWYPHAYEGPALPNLARYPRTAGTGRWDYGPLSKPPMVPTALPASTPSSR